MTNEQRDKLKRRCGAMLRNSGMKPSSVSGQKAIQAFWIGAVAALNEDQPPAFVTICLLSGRTDDLVDMRSTDED